MFKFVLGMVFIAIFTYMCKFGFDARDNLAIVLKTHDMDAFIKMGYDLMTVIGFALAEICVLLLVIVSVLNEKPRIINQLNEEV